MTFRDYKKARATSNITGIPVNFIESSENCQGLMEGISFMSFAIFTQLIKGSSQDNKEELAVIADEFDHIIFGEGGF